jgi:serine/threonine protein kinase
VGEDGTIKVADFGSSQISDNKEGQVSGYVQGVTAPIKAPEMNTKPTVTGKADTYTLGTMLAMLTSDSHAYEIALSEGEKDYRSPRNLTALDRLKNSMLDPDPTKRPTLESVETSAYFSDVTGTYSDEQMQELAQATIKYGKLVPSSVAKKRDTIAEKRAEIIKEEKKKNGKSREEISRIEQTIQLYRNEIAVLEKECKDETNGAIQDYVLEHPEEAKAIEKMFAILEKAQQDFK